MIVYNLFPTAVAKFELGRDYTAEELTFIYGQPTRANTGNSTSKSQYVLRHESMSGLKNFIESSLCTYLKQIYDPKNNVSLRITQSWLNYTKPGQFHHKHSHENSFVSGVLYIKASHEKDKIHFYNESYRQIYLSTENFNVYNSRSWWLQVNTGELMLFPSSMTHMVDRVKDDERISLAFNTFPIGNVGEDLELTALNLEGT